jgi:diadenosine tetraphosphate (Ap4A) HIT family hydrolase
LAKQDRPDWPSDVAGEDAPCDFCEEAAGRPGERFTQIYGPQAKSRIVASVGGLVALPTIGQIVPKMLLVMPNRHVETLASLRADEHRQLQAFARALAARTAPDNQYLLFEHGAQQVTGESCGIYHAHLHVVPLTRVIEPTDLAAETWTSTDDLAQSLAAIGSSDHYFMYGAAESSAYLDLRTAVGRYGSQHLRKKLVELLGVDCHWNWRKYASPEPLVLEVVDLFVDAPNVL